MYITHLTQPTKWVMHIVHDKTHIIFLLNMFGSKHLSKNYINLRNTQYFKYIINIFA